ncbi:monofunctional biosynthetic peptidoglycan transglycosylase [Mariprofundus ferrooxydans]|uniref:Biosynthetic peptidoglycan transglycosylase n=1 Tax=Mariprofundus ferrooxydans PV-1 TaxID=314345 RepID=Q0EWZ6_9PROT|nr:monofunctional biosynthetic peptidoglycan transglycosylase [Mariprofundus ferrooxydans]EAU53761.1 monofunctional biosynthetic peptidoglycan transglycosylase [Mariprofundus ferrooxydans PV-1]KON47513.1 peptidoglycan transglycosylase [Mariprofundus ferrooxydans]
MLTSTIQERAPVAATALPVIKLFKYALLAALILLTGWLGWAYSQVLTWRAGNPQMSAFMQQDLESRHIKNPKARLKHHPVPYKRISVNLKRAVIAAEDASFVDHNGFDLDGIQLAMEKNLKAGHITAGGSTISQQLAKNLFLSGERTLLRKAEEAIYTVMLEATLSKRRILELYLNYAEWGNRIYGAEAAARHYYGIPASMLSPWQAARLAAILPNPRYYDGRRTEWISEKSNTIRHYMPMVRIPR